MKVISLQSEYVNCNLCGADDTELLFVTKDYRFQLRGDFNIIKCRRCGLIYVNPRPTEEEIGVYYPKEEYHPSPKFNDSVSLRQKVKDFVIKSSPGYDTKTKRLNKILGKFLGKILSEQIDVIVPFRDNGKILDVGCGNGQLTGWMKEHGWRTYGVDINKEACEQAERLGLNIFCGELQNANYTNDFFDVIIIHHALEHLYDPLALLKECFRILKRDGILIIDCPNFGCFQNKLFGSKWFAIDAPRHLYHFECDTLRKLLITAGFKIDKWKFQFPFPFRESDSLRFYALGNKETSFVNLLRLWLETNMIIMLRYIFNKDRGPKFSINLTVYALKSSGGEY